MTNISDKKAIDLIFNSDTPLEHTVLLMRAAEDWTKTDLGTGIVFTYNQPFKPSESFIKKLKRIKKINSLGYGKESKIQIGFVDKNNLGLGYYVDITN